MESLNVRVWNEISTELRKFVFRKVKDRDVANDIVQDVFIKVQSKISQLRENEKIAGWIFQITRHTIFAASPKHSLLMSFSGTMKLKT